MNQKRIWFCIDALNLAVLYYKLDYIHITCRGEDTRLKLRETVAAHTASSSWNSSIWCKCKQECAVVSLPWALKLLCCALYITTVYALSFYFSNSIIMMVPFFSTNPVVVCILYCFLSCNYLHFMLSLEVISLFRLQLSIQVQWIELFKTLLCEFNMPAVFNYGCIRN